ncbi:MAG TPA: permease, partial [Planctomycetota bacterium]|nr:permease [Planctomycetota bacterium]
GGGKLTRALRYGFMTLPHDIGKALLVGIVIAGFISALVTPEDFARELPTGVTQILLLMLLGIPIYVCATASVPVAAALILNVGVTPGAALAFLMTGPATNAAAIATIWKIMGRKTAIIYLLAVAVTAFAAGLILDVSFPELADSIRAWKHAHHEASTWWMVVQWTSAAALLVVLGFAIFKPTLGRLGGPVPVEAVRQSVTLHVEGMTCSHCVGAVTAAVEEQSGVLSAEVELKTGRVLVQGTAFDVEAVRRAIEELGYKATAMTTQRNQERKEGNHG